MTKQEIDKKYSLYDGTFFQKRFFFSQSTAVNRSAQGKNAGCRPGCHWEKGFFFSLSGKKRTMRQVGKAIAGLGE